MQPIFTQHQSTKQQILSFVSKPLRTDIIMSAKSLLPNAENERNPLTMSDEQILEQIYSTHVHGDTKFDVDSLFTLVENTLRRSTRIVDNVVQVYMHSFLLFFFPPRFCFTFTYPSIQIFMHFIHILLQGSHASLETIDDKIPQFNSPLCTLKQISSEVMEDIN